MGLPSASRSVCRQSLVVVVVLLTVTGGSVGGVAGAARVHVDKTQQVEQVDGGVDVRRTEHVLAQQLGRHEALNDVVAAAAKPARATFRCRE